MITTAALKSGGSFRCYLKHLLFCTGMLAIARQTDKYKQTLNCRISFDIFVNFSFPDKKTHLFKPQLPALRRSVTW
jgi:hypothetical protein